MATVSPEHDYASHEVIEYQRYIEDQLRKTRGHVRTVDLSAALLTLAVGAVGYLLLVVLADHWLFAGGLGFWGRFLALGRLLGGSLFFICWKILPLLIRRIN